MSTPRRHYSQEFKDKLAEEVIVFSKPVALVTAEYEVSAQTLGKWVKKYQQTHEAREETASKKPTARELALEREKQELQAELACLKATEAYFNNDSQ